MAEEQIWKGHSSLWKNLGSYVLLVITTAVAVWLHATQPWGAWAYIAVAVVALWALWKLIVIKATTYQLTTERLVTTRGIFTKVTDTLELYRVRDLQIVQPLALRILGLENIHLLASDATTEAIVIDYLPAKLHLGEKLRKAIEDCREKKRVRAYDVVTDEGGTPGEGLPG
jgi:uncharacterized membrane protein YdbT with pleckstrin-like domain